MTRIISLWMKNFKSFGKATQIHFSDKLTGIVGPNGSGKSNVLDAICFVLGRTATVSAMRARKGGDLIFMRPGGHAEDFAEVKLVLDNNHHGSQVFGDMGEQVTISRRVRQDGLSAYRVNGRRAKKNQVLDLLAMAKIFPDGHNIVLQGDIAGIIRKNSEERRKIIDEIVGIEEYEEKKRKAQLEFEHVATRIAEVDVLVNERRRALDRLAKERDRAAKYVRLQELKGLLEASITKRKLEELERIRQKLSEDMGTKASEVEEAKKKISDSEGLIWKMKGELSTLERKISGAQSQESLGLVRELERLKANRERKKEQVARLAGDIEKIVQRQAEFSKSMAGLESTAASLQERLEKEKEKGNALSEKRQDAERKRLALIGSFAKADLKRSESLKKIQELEAEIVELTSEKRLLSIERDRAADSAHRKQEELESAESKEKNVSAIEKKMAGLKGVMRERQEILSGWEKELATVLGEADAKKDELARLQAEASLIRAGTLTVIRKVLEAAKAGEVKGVICQAKDILPSEGRHVAMLRAAAGDPNAIIVDCRENAAKIVDFLARQNAGRATLVFLDPENKPKESELVEMACPKDAEAREMLRFLFDGRSVVSGLDDALEKKNAVTPDGLLVDGHRIVTTPGSTISDMFSTNEQLSKILARKGELEKNITDARNGISAMALDMQRLELELKELAGEGGLNERLRALAAEKDAALGLKEKHAKSIDELSSRIKSMENWVSTLQCEPEATEGGMEKLTELEDELSALRKEEEGYRLSVQEVSSRLSNAVLPEIEETKKMMRQLAKDKEAAEKEKTRLEPELNRLEERLQEMSKKLESAIAGVKELISRKDRLFGEIGRGQEEMYRMLGRVTALEAETASLRQRVSELEVEINALSAQLVGEKRTNKFLYGSQKRLQAKLQRVSGKLEKMGAVNLIALTEFSSAEEEFKEIEERKAKLEAEKQAILGFMAEVEKKKNAAFMESFTVIASNFSRVFGQLTGGTGSLLLENPEHPLEAGLIVQASPKGKEVYRIESMSGGEQTMTALAFIFAIQEHKPAPFYVFDEADAALDKDNSKRLADLFSEYSKKSQMAVITHNDPIMKVCNQLVGVYLREGMSHVLSATPEFLKKHLPTTT